MADDREKLLMDEIEAYEEQLERSRPAAGAYGRRL